MVTQAKYDPYMDQAELPTTQVSMGARIRLILPLICLCACCDEEDFVNARVSAGVEM